MQQQQQPPEQNVSKEFKTKQITKKNHEMKTYKYYQEIRLFCYDFRFSINSQFFVVSASVCVYDDNDTKCIAQNVFSEKLLSIVGKNIYFRKVKKLVT